MKKRVNNERVFLGLVFRPSLPARCIVLDVPLSPQPIDKVLNVLSKPLFFQAHLYQK